MASMLNSVLASIIYLLCVGVSCFPVPNRSTSRKLPFYSDNLVDYLTQFGYLPEADRETGYLRTDSQLKDAIKNLQRFGNIPQTGEIDEATQVLMSKPRCGVPDAPVGGKFGGRKKRFAIHGQKWPSTDLSWSLRTKHFNGSLDRGTLRADLYNALNVWAQHTKLTFSEVNSENADILVYFEKGYHGDGYPFDGQGQILAHAFFPGNGRGGDVHFDIEEKWLLSGDQDSDEGTNLLIVAAHEFGHSLGLSHSSVRGALMYPWYNGLQYDFKLSDDDRYGIQQLYGAKDKLWGKNYGDKPVHRWPVRPPSVPPATTPSTTTTTKEPRTTTSTSPRPTRRTIQRDDDLDKPDTCNTSYDAISVIRREVFIFKGKYIWRIGDRGLYMGYPAQTIRLWNDLPKNFTHVDAVYERLDKKIVFFIGRYYYVFDGNLLEPGYPRPITDMGLPDSLKKIDAAMVWGYNSKTYLFSGTTYWRLDEDVGSIELDYPRDMSVWGGIGYDIDSVFQWKDGATYFFKDKGFWKFNDQKMRVENDTPMQSALFWMGCPSIATEDPTRGNDIPTSRPRVSSTSDGSIVQINSVTVLLTVTLFTLIS